MATLPDTLYLANDFYLEVGPLTAFAVADGAEVVQTGKTVGAFLADTDTEDATPIDASLSITLTEEGTSGIYRGIFEGGDLTTHLKPTYVDQAIFCHIASGEDYHVVWSLTVKDGRAP
jgi:hypothetical protein